jgi:Ca2+-binding RTX toxin-like protein
MTTYRTRLSVYQSGQGSGSTNTKDVSGLTSQFDVGLSGRQWTSHNISGGFSNYAISSRKIPIDTPSIRGNFISFNAKNLSPQNGQWSDWVVDIFDIARNVITDKVETLDGYNDYFQRFRGFAYKEPPNIGMAIRLEQYGNDIVMPNGRGEIMYGLGREYDPRFPTFDYHYTFVIVQNGVDSVVGGFGNDIILSESMSYVDAEAKYRLKLNSAENNIGGSKFFVGGSGDDFLSGGRDGDLLIGDRFNNYELYLNREALSKNVPVAFEENAKRLLNYQPPDYNNGNYNGKDIDWTRGIGKENSISGDGMYNGQGYGQMWFNRPGCDVIHGNGGDDIIYGDGNIEDINELYHFKQAANEYGMVAPNGQENWSSLLIGADFIDGGSGNDVIHAGYGADAIIGGKGSDIIYCGDQIVAPEYQPLWGPKIVWGGAYKDKTDLTPDLFVVGDMYTQESQLMSAEDIKNIAKEAEEKAVSDKWVNFFQSITDPIASDAQKNLISFFTSLASLMSKDQSSVPDVSVKETNSLVGVTVIRDFAANDLMTLKIRVGEGMKGSGAVVPFDYNAGSGKSSLYPFNPIIDGGVQARGKSVVVTQKAGNPFDGVILEGYTGNLWKLNSQTLEDGSRLLLLGGDAYSSFSGAELWG